MAGIASDKGNQFFSLFFSYTRLVHTYNNLPLMFQIGEEEGQTHRDGGFILTK